MKCFRIATLVSFISFAMIISIYSWGASKAKKTIKFSEILNDSEMTGLLADSLESRQETESQYQSYKKSEVEFNKQCLDQNLAKSPFCLLVNQNLEEHDRVQSVKKRLRKQRLQQVLHKAIQTKINDDLYEFNENELTRVFQSFKRVDQLKGLAQRLLKSSTCVPSTLLVALGLKMESKLPDSLYRKTAFELYQRAAECGQDSSAIQAKYRVGLFHIWEDKCDLAEKTLSSIPDSLQSLDYRMRIAYWRWHCADQRKDESTKLQLKAWLLHEYPLSLHALLVRMDSSKENPYLREQIDPEILFRSTEVQYLNEVTRAVEYLISKDEKSEAEEILKENLSKVHKSEVGFQLYWVVLLRRVDSIPSSFQLLASLFKNNPSLISKATLQHLYPQSLFPLVQQNSLEIDPFFVLSLIRQESAFDSKAKSQAGAMGLMQLQLPTARRFEKVSLNQLSDPNVNVRVGVKYVKKLLTLYRGRTDYALAAYNAGPGRLIEWRRRYPVKNQILFLDLLPFKETRDYVSSVLRNYYWYLSLYAPTELDQKIGNIQDIYTLQLSNQSK